MNGGRNSDDILRRIAERGREAVVLEEMIRLGFLRPKKGGDASAALTEFLDGEATIAAVENELASVQRELHAGTDVESQLANIRRARIERVRAKRELRRAEKASRLAEKREAFRQQTLKAPLYLGRGVSGGLRFSDEISPQLQERGLPLIRNAEELAAALGIEPSKLLWLCFHRDVATIDHYQRFYIPKRSGGKRPIASPKKVLRRAQQWVFDTVLPHLQPHTGVAMAFRRGVSIVTNARFHCGKAVVVRMDIQDFFPSITFPRVRGLFRACGYNEGVATLLALICTESPRAVVEFHGKTYFVATGPRALPQGACTSPGLANYLCRRLDLRLRGFADSLGFIYTRYADDLAFSHPQPKLPVRLLTKVVSDILRAEGFITNESKTLVMRQHRAQTVTGIVVNTSPRVSRRDVRRFRAIAHQCRVDGFDAVSARLGRDARSYLNGYLSFVRMVNREQANAMARLVSENGHADSL